METSEQQEQKSTETQTRQGEVIGKNFTKVFNLLKVDERHEKLPEEDKQALLELVESRITQENPPANKLFLARCFWCHNIAKHDQPSFPMPCAECFKLKLLWKDISKEVENLCAKTF